MSSSSNELRGSARAEFDRHVIARWRAPVTREAEHYGVPPAWIYGVIWAESRGRPDARSADGGYGLMQLTSREALDGIAPEAAMDPAVNIHLGTRLLARIQARLSPPITLPRVASAYNAGMAGHEPHHASNSWGLRESPGYIDSVVRAATTALSLLAASPAGDALVLLLAAAALWWTA